MLFAGWEVRIGKNCAQGLECAPPYTSPLAQVLSIQTKQGQQITFLLYRITLKATFGSNFNESCSVQMRTFYISGTKSYWNL